MAKDPDVCLPAYQNEVVGMSLAKMREELSGKVTKDDAVKALAMSEKLARQSLKGMCDLKKAAAKQAPGAKTPPAKSFKP